ncbi:MAG: redox-sensing transcriptional repressor Rex [Clostridiales bacterium]|nr:redox-sensing transcriptional repressor Rex [Clostridiales bacterium]
MDTRLPTSSDDSMLSAEDKEKTIPAALLSRLPQYYICLKDLVNRDIMRVSSRELSKALDITDSQVRQDFARIGDYGRQGYGYSVRELIIGVSDILGITDEFSAVIIGANVLGLAIASDSLFSRHGVLLKGIFNFDGTLVGQRVGNTKVYPLDELIPFIVKEKVDIAVLTTTEGYDPSELIDNGSLRGIWNFTNRFIERGEKTLVHNVSLGDSLMTLCCKIKRLKEGR